MANWESFPFELLTLIVDILVADNDRKSLTQFSLVCKHWENAVGYVNFTIVNITTLDDLSKLNQLLMINQAIGSAIKYVNIDVTEEEDQFAELTSHVYYSTPRNPHLEATISDYKDDRDKSYTNLFSVLLRLIPNVKSLQFMRNDNHKWHNVVEKHVDVLQHLEEFAPPIHYIRDCKYIDATLKLFDKLKKVTFLVILPCYTIYHSKATMIRYAKKFTQLTEIRFLLLDGNCILNHLELVLDSVCASVNSVAITTTISAGLPMTVKLVFPLIDTSTTKQLLHIRKLRTDDSYLCDDNAIEYITHKFPNLQELVYNIQEKPWDSHEKCFTRDRPDQLSPGAQTMYFEYFMKMDKFDIFGFYRLEEYNALMSRWMTVANSIEDKRVELIINEDGYIEENCFYVFWRKESLEKTYNISINYRYRSDWSCSRFIPSIGSCLESITLENVELNSQMLSAIYEGCPILSRLAFLDVVILEEINTGEITSNLTHMTFKNVTHVTARHISSITKNLTSLHTLQVIDTALDEAGSEDEPLAEDHAGVTYKDLEIDASASRLSKIIYMPVCKGNTTHEFAPPWCVIINNDKLYVNPNALTEGPYKQVAFAEEVPLSQLEDYRKQIVPSKRNRSYCLRLKSKGLHIFQLAKHAKPLPDRVLKKEDCKKSAVDVISIVINE